MLNALMRRFSRDRKAATAMVVALCIVPMLLLCGAAVDYSRVAAARAQLQAAADAAAIAGDGAYQNENNAANAKSVASAAFNSSAANLNTYSAITLAPVVTGSGTSCANGDTYCVSVAAAATLKNSLLGGWIPSEALRVSATAESNGSTSTNCQSASACVNANSSTGVTPGGTGGSLIVSSYHIAGVGSPESNTTNNNPNGGVSAFDIFLNGDNSSLPPTGSYTAPSQDTADPCSSTQQAQSQTLNVNSVIYNAQNVAVSCDGSGKCTLPGGTYCGNLTIASGMTVTLGGANSSYPAIYIEDGDLLVSPASFIVCSAAVTPVATPPATTPCRGGDNASALLPIYFGGSHIGSMVLQQLTTIDPSGMSSGFIEYISTFNSVNVQTSGTTTQLEAGVCEFADSYCTNPITAAAGVITYSGAGTITYNDTYVTTITISGGAETMWAQTEVLAAQFQTSSGTSTTTQTVTYSGTYPQDPNPTKNTPPSASTYSPSTTTPATTVDCTQNGSNPSWKQLYNQTTLGSSGNPNLGYSYASSNITGDGLLAEEITVCGVGSALASSGGSGTGNTVAPTGTSSNPVLTN